MPKFVRSSRGEIVDFDLLKLKADMASKPAPVEVTERSNFIDNKLKRRIRTIKQNITNSQSIKNLELQEDQEDIQVLENQPVEETSIVSETLIKKPRKIKKSIKSDDPSIT